ncbi:hypothetical protein OJAV_G00157140 [Oryzias javanicus]|uniref:BTB domain-containing protein n=1 Tax=Oryzias javanicus TaxID=123683 RepID=A0A437CIN1_ORYJA|nr:hypothetical protein OJAV_G00157140 [Oryzias javanicus]
MEAPLTEVHHYRDKEQSSSLLLQLHSLRQENILTDVLLCSGTTQIPCHRAVLVSSSPYFRAMFCHDFVEKQQTKIDLKGISPTILSSIIDYVYTGLVSLSMEVVLPLMQVASMLQYVRLFEICSSFLQEHLSPDNCLSMIRLSEIMNCRSLREKAREMAMKSFSEVSACEDLCELSLSELMGYLDDDNLCAEEEQVFEALVAWIHHDPMSRSGTISDLFKKVRLRHIHPTYLFQFIANDPLIQSSTLCTELIESVRRLMFCVDLKCIQNSTVDLSPLWHAPRRSAYQETLVVIGGRKNSEQTSREALAFDELTQRWKWLAKVPVRLYKPSYVALHSVLNQWRTAESMLEPRFAHRSVSYLHFIFVLGGLGPDRRLTSSVQRYNSMFNQWEWMAPMPEAVLHPAVAATNQRIYMFGGEDALKNPVRLIQVYHIGRNMWSKMENRTVKNVSAPAVVVDELIYIVGGYTRRMLAYDAKTNRFTVCANLKERKMHHSAVVLNNKLYVTGGRYLTGQDDVEDSNAFEVYDSKTDSWTSAGSLPHKLFDHGSVTLTCVSETRAKQN